MKTILVTGASSGIGRALAVRAARAGYAVYAVGRNVKALAALGAQVSAEGGMIATDATDVSDPANAPGLIGRTIGAFGRLDVLVNNAGAVAVGPIAAQSDEDLRAQFGTHVIGPLALVREALPALRASRGHVFMLGSGVARVPVGGLGAYPPSKAALRSATAILRRELLPLEVAVTYVDPGAVDTAFMRRAGMPGAPQSVLVSPELVARKILLAVATRPRVLNVAPLQTAAVTMAELLPALTDAVLARNPSLIGGGPSLTAIQMQRDGYGRSEKIALPASLPLPPAPPPSDDATSAEPPPLELPLAPTPVATVVETATIDVVAEEITPVDVESAVELAAGEGDIDAPPVVRWTFEPPEADATNGAEPVVARTTVADESETDADDDLLFGEPDPVPVAHDDEPATATSSYDAALEPLARRMERAHLDPEVIRNLLVVDAVIDVNEVALQWAGMPNKHERALTSEIFFALAEWGFLAPRADGRYRVLKPADDPLPR